jgi:hypothetical protein
VKLFPSSIKHQPALTKSVFIFVSHSTFRIHTLFLVMTPTFCQSSMFTPSQNTRGLGVSAKILLSTFCSTPLTEWSTKEDRLGSCERQRPNLSFPSLSYRVREDTHQKHIERILLCPDARPGESRHESLQRRSHPGKCFTRSANRLAQVTQHSQRGTKS